MKKQMMIILLEILVMCFCGCTLETEATPYDTQADIENTRAIADSLVRSQATPTDIDYSLERYNLIRRAYWVNGQREKANTLVCGVEKPLGYIVLFTENGGVVGKFVVDGKVSSLNSYLTPDSEYYSLEYGGTYIKENNWIADVDGSYGENDKGIFFFDVMGNYIEWTGTYLYTDIPMSIENPVITFEVNYDGK